MEKVSVDPYVFFKGNCRQAMEFYKGIFGGELTIQSYGEAPAGAVKKEGLDDKIMHAMLDGEVKIMASDSPFPDTIGTGKVSITLSGTDEDKLTKWFNALCEGVKTDYPLKKEFWGDTFGMVRDKYDVDWMVSISSGKAHEEKA